MPEIKEIPKILVGIGRPPHKSFEVHGPARLPSEEEKLVITTSGFKTIEREGKSRFDQELFEKVGNNVFAQQSIDEAKLAGEQRYNEYLKKINVARKVSRRTIDFAKSAIGAHSLKQTWTLEELSKKTDAAATDLLREHTSEIHTRFQNAFDAKDEKIRAEKGEQLKIVDETEREGKTIITQGRKLMRMYADGTLNEAQFQKQSRDLWNLMKALEPQLLRSTDLYMSSLAEAAKALRIGALQGIAMDKIAARIAQSEFRIGFSMLGKEENIQQPLLRRVVTNIHKTLERFKKKPLGETIYIKVTWESPTAQPAPAAAAEQPPTESVKQEPEIPQETLEQPTIPEPVPVQSEPAEEVPPVPLEIEKSEATIPTVPVQPEAAAEPSIDKPAIEIKRFVKHEKYLGRNRPQLWDIAKQLETTEKPNEKVILLQEGLRLAKTMEETASNPNERRQGKELHQLLLNQLAPLISTEAANASIDLLLRLKESKAPERYRSRFSNLILQLTPGMSPEDVQKNLQQLTNVANEMAQEFRENPNNNAWRIHRVQEAENIAAEMQGYLSKFPKIESPIPQPEAIAEPSVPESAQKFPREAEFRKLVHEQAQRILNKSLAEEYRYKNGSLEGHIRGRLAELNSGMLSIDECETVFASSENIKRVNAVTFETALDWKLGEVTKENVLRRALVRAIESEPPLAFESEVDKEAMIQRHVSPESGMIYEEDVMPDGLLENKENVIVGFTEVKAYTPEEFNTYLQTLLDLDRKGELLSQPNSTKVRVNIEKNGRMETMELGSDLEREIKFIDDVCFLGFGDKMLREGTAILLRFPSDIPSASLQQFGKLLRDKFHYAHVMIQKLPLSSKQLAEYELGIRRNEAQTMLNKVENGTYTLSKAKIEEKRQQEGQEKLQILKNYCSQTSQ